MLNNMKVDFVGKKKLFALISIAILVVCLVVNLIIGTVMDIQFTGGTIIKYSYTGDVSESVLKDTLKEFTDGKEKYAFAYDVITTGDDTNPNNVSVSLPVQDKLSPETMTAMLEKLQTAAPAANFRQIESSTVEATMGQEFFGKCLVAIVLASVLMLVYVAIRFRKIGGWSAGLMALLALLNDVLIAYFVFVIFRIPLDDNFVAVVLSILGYSLNGTIVIYDRIRENRRLLGAKSTLGEIVNLSINQSFRRTLHSSITTLIAVTCITVVAMAYGLDSILSFSIPLMFGIISGFYTSTCLTAPLWVGMRNQMAKARARKAERANAK